MECTPPAAFCKNVLDEGDLMMGKDGFIAILVKTWKSHLIGYMCVNGSNPIMP